MRAFREFKPGIGFASAAVFISASLWGLFWIPIRYFDENGIDGVWAITLLNLPAALALVVIVAATWRKQRTHLVPAMAIGFFAGFGLSLYGLGIVHGSVIRVTLLFYLSPIWATFIGLYWLGEASSWQRWAAIAIGLAGLLCLVGGGGGQPLGIADALGLASGILWAIGASIIKRQGKIPLSGMSMFQFMFLCLFALLGGYALGPIETPSIADVMPVAPVFLAISLIMVLPSVFLLFWASQFLFPGRVGLLMMSEVMVALISASILLPDEALGPVQWVGAILIVGASVVELLPARKKSAAHSARL